MNQTHLNFKKRRWPREPEDIPPSRVWILAAIVGVKHFVSYVRTRLQKEWSRRTLYGKARLPIDILGVTFVGIPIAIFGLFAVIMEVSWTRLIIYTTARIVPFTAPSRIQPKVYKDDSENQRRAEDAE